MKILIIWIFIVGGPLIGVTSIYLGIKKYAVEKQKFNVVQFLKKGFSPTKYNEFSGYERIALGIFSIVGGLLMYIIYYKF